MRPLTRGTWRTPNLAQILVIILCLAWLASPPAHAASVDISTVTQSRNLLGAMSVHRDASGQFTPEEAARRPGVVPASPLALRFGFTTATLWLQLRVGNASRGAVTRWLSLGHARLEYVDVYRLDASGSRVEASWPGGVARPLTARPIPGKESLFPVTLAPGEEALLLLRIHGRTLTALDVSIWDPTHYREREAAADLQLLVPAGALLAVAIYLLVSALYRRDLPFIMLALWMCSAVACELAIKGYLYRFLITAGGEPAIRAPVFFLNMSLGLAAAFIHSFLAADKASVLGKVLLGISLAGFALALGAPFGDVQVLATAFLGCLTVLCLAYPFLLVSAWRRRHPNFGLFIVALSGLWGTVLARMLVMLGILPPSEISNVTLSMVYAAGLGCAAMLGVVRRTITQHQDTLSRQNARLQAQQKEHARLEAAIERRTRALQNALIDADEANRAKSDFLARVSHDLRAPLTAILGYADLIIGNGGGQADNGRVIRRSAQHLLGLLNDLIDYARGSSQPDALQPLPVYTASLLNSIAAEGESLARRTHNRFDYQLSCALPAVIEVDEKRLRQILINLLDNAAKFTHHGHIRFSVQCQGEGNADEPLPIVFMVEDTGPGMAPGELDHIFEPFQRLKATESHEGLGLGLAIAKQWADCMNGHIQAESTSGQGTRMRVTMHIKPASEDALSYPHQTCREDNLPELDGDGRRVWVVEDSHEIRNLLCVELRSQGFTALPIANGHDALTLLANPATPVPDLVLTDLKMPFASGEDVLAGARGKWPELPVVLLTATPDAAIAAAASTLLQTQSMDAAARTASSPDAAKPAREHFSAILSKPVSLLLLRQTLADLLGLECASPASTAEDTAALAYPDAARLAEALALVRMGAISDLIDWADTLTAENPAWSDFATQARALAERGEMPRLLSLCQPLLPAAPP
ncbi:Sensor histidine kinase TmoS [Thauera sp. GDN1]|nr:Sensor histidine kinase TmoS [Thauera sp. GDN1]